jgi:hypothetical protein
MSLYIWILIFFFFNFFSLLFQIIFLKYFIIFIPIYMLDIFSKIFFLKMLLILISISNKISHNFIIMVFLFFTKSISKILPSCFRETYFIEYRIIITISLILLISTLIFENFSLNYLSFIFKYLRVPNFNTYYCHRFHQLNL